MTPPPPPPPSPSLSLLSSSSSSSLFQQQPFQQPKTATPATRKDTRRTGYSFLAQTIAFMVVYRKLFYAFWILPGLVVGFPLLIQTLDWITTATTLTSLLASSSSSSTSSLGWLTLVLTILYNHVLTHILVPRLLDTLAPTTRQQQVRNHVLHMHNQGLRYLVQAFLASIMTVRGIMVLGSFLFGNSGTPNNINISTSNNKAWWGWLEQQLSVSVPIWLFLRLAVTVLLLQILVLARYVGPQSMIRCSCIPLARNPVQIILQQWIQRPLLMFLEPSETAAGIFASSGNGGGQQQRQGCRFRQVTVLALLAHCISAVLVGTMTSHVFVCHLFTHYIYDNDELDDEARILCWMGCIFTALLPITPHIYSVAAGTFSTLTATATPFLPLQEMDPDLYSSFWITSSSSSVVQKASVNPNLVQAIFITPAVALVLAVVTLIATTATVTTTAIANEWNELFAADGVLVLSGWPPTMVMTKMISAGWESILAVLQVYPCLWLISALLYVFDIFLLKPCLFAPEYHTDVVAWLQHDISITVQCLLASEPWLAQQILQTTHHNNSDDDINNNNINTNYYHRRHHLVEEQYLHEMTNWIHCFARHYMMISSSHDRVVDIDDEYYYHLHCTTYSDAPLEQDVLRFVVLEALGGGSAAGTKFQGKRKVPKRQLDWIQTFVALRPPNYSYTTTTTTATEPDICLLVKTLCVLAGGMGLALSMIRCPGPGGCDNKTLSSSTSWALDYFWTVPPGMLVELRMALQAVHWCFVVVAFGAGVGAGNGGGGGAPVTTTTTTSDSTRMLPATQMQLGMLVPAVVTALYQVWVGVRHVLSANQTVAAADHRLNALIWQCHEIAVDIVQIATTGVGGDGTFTHSIGGNSNIPLQVLDRTVLDWLLQPQSQRAGLAVTTTTTTTPLQ